MNNIQSNTAAVKRIVSSRNDAAFPAAVTHRQGKSTDQSLMYAWSIGTTLAAQEHAKERPAVKHEECPPEVYIG